MRAAGSSTTSGPSPSTICAGRNLARDVGPGGGHGDADVRMPRRGRGLVERVELAPFEHAQGLAADPDTVRDSRLAPRSRATAETPRSASMARMRLERR